MNLPAPVEAALQALEQAMNQNPCPVWESTRTRVVFSPEDLTRLRQRVAEEW